ncbi:hypothetical protein KIS4809_1408 [Bacillus sp. ZZV12-4809]|nr:hypothetical protein KIS4809_1408 [Bacillus sp. ZZV12-4809]
MGTCNNQHPEEELFIYYCKFLQKKIFSWEISEFHVET